MGGVFAKVIVVLGVCVGAVVLIAQLWRVGDRPYQPPGGELVRGRRLEARLLAGLVAVVAAGVVTALLTWPTG
ncbi:hypothetical protein [Sphaerisporangium aureirubrum]|uniref:Uncharacterized protein n=1 Tax=Sphaerisporangium aureirubrum TaxID=1544736 RepID=A0ABW1NE28_9ACTN